MEATAKSRTTAGEGCQPAPPRALGECGSLLLKAGAGNQPVPWGRLGCWDPGVLGEGGDGAVRGTAVRYSRQLWGH